MGRPGVIVNRKKFIDAIRKHGGHVERTCKEAGISKSTFARYYNLDPHIQDEIDTARDKREIEEHVQDLDILEKAYEALISLIDKRDVATIIYTMRTLGRKRNAHWGLSYQPNNENDGKNTITIKHQVANDRPGSTDAVSPTLVSGGLHQCDDGGQEESVSALPPSSGEGHSVLELHDPQGA